MNTEQSHFTLETVSATTSLHTPASSSERIQETNPRPETTIPKAYSIALPPVLTEENASGMTPSVSGSKISTNLPEEVKKGRLTPTLLPSSTMNVPTSEVAAAASVTPPKVDTDFPEPGVKDATSRSAESPSPLPKDKLEEHESLTEIIAKETPLEETTVISQTELTQEMLVEQVQDEKDSAQGVVPTEEVLEQTVEMPPVSEEKEIETLPLRRKADRPQPRRASLKKQERKREYNRIGNTSSGSVVFAQVKGFPFWPAMVLEPTDVPEAFLPKKMGMTMLCVMFYGTYEYGFLQEKDVIPFEPNLELILNSNPYKKHLEAIKEAQINPSIVLEVNRKFQENQKYIGMSNELQEDEEMLPPLEEEGKVTPKRGRRPLPVSPTSKENENKKTSVASSKSSPSVTPSQRRRGTVSPSEKDDTTPTSKRVKHQRSAPNVEPAVPSRSTKHSTLGAVYAKNPSPASLAARAEASKRSHEATYNTLMRFRHILQKTFIKDKSSEKKPKACTEMLHTLEWHVINSALDELARYLKHPEFDVDLFKTTKLPKVLSLISVAKFEPIVEEKMQEQNIRNKVTDLLENIRVLLPPPPPSSSSTSSSTIPTSTTTTSSNSSITTSSGESATIQPQTAEETVVETSA